MQLQDELEKLKDENEKRHTVDEWGKYTLPIPETQEFTACIWAKIQFFALDIIPLWSYCTLSILDIKGITKNETAFRCIQLYLRPEIKTWNQQIQTIGWLEEFEEVKATISNYNHRKWNI